jgi:hypothetical protein
VPGAAPSSARSLRARDRGVARGELDPNVDPEVALDLIFGAAMYRMAIGHAGLTSDDADAIVATAMRALALIRWSELS